MTNEPTGTPSPNRIEEIFQGALDLQGEARQEYINKTCGADGKLRRRVEALLRHAEDMPGGFLPETPATPVSTGSEKRGDRIGQYTLDKEIGSGGFGVVCKAFQETPFRRDVALKIIKAGMDTREVIARFENERQALAMMEHPH